jgi:predicted secreted protein
MRIVFVLLLLLLVPLGCGGDDAPEEESVPETETGTRSVDVAEEAPEVITEDDDGTAFTLRVGEDTLLRLTSEYVWDEPFVGGASLRLDRVDYLQDPGYAEWIVNAVDTGIGLIATVGEPQCPEGGDDCPDDPRDFQVRIIVE